MLLNAKKGYIYEYDDGKSEEKRYVLVVSSDTRAKDRLVNTIMLGSSNLGHDVVPITYEALGETRYLHCGMITYTKREFLVKEIGKISPEDLKKVESTICYELSLREDVVAQMNFYKNAYEDLLAKVMNTNTGE